MSPRRQIRSIQFCSSGAGHEAKATLEILQRWSKVSQRSYREAEKFGGNSSSHTTVRTNGSSKVSSPVAFDPVASLAFGLKSITSLAEQLDHFATFRWSCASRPLLYLLDDRQSRFRHFGRQVIMVIRIDITTDFAPEAPFLQPARQCLGMMRQLASRNVTKCGRVTSCLPILSLMDTPKGSTE